jgi:hypothetical protein
MVEHLFDTVSERLAPHLVEPRALTRHTLPVDDAFAPLFPDGGLVRGTSVALGADPATGGATSLALAVAAAPSRTGSWVAVAGFPNLGFAALEGCGMDPGHVLVVPRLPSAVWARALAVLVAAVDVVVLGPPSGGSSGGSVPPRAGRRLATAARERGAVVLTAGWEVPGFDPAVRLEVVASRWEGVEEGHGHLTARRVEVARTGRAAAARPLRRALWLPDADGRVRPAPDDATVLRWPGAGR